MKNDIVTLEAQHYQVGDFIRLKFSHFGSGANPMIDTEPAGEEFLVVWSTKGNCINVRPSTRWWRFWAGKKHALGIR